MKKTLLKKVLHNGKEVDILIEGKKFKKIAEEIKEDVDVVVIDCKGKAIEPAFYNCHTHIPMILLKGVSDEKDLQDWLEKDIFPREAKMDENDICIASKFAILEMIKGGTVFCNDMYFFPEKIMQAINEMKIRDGIITIPNLDKHEQFLFYKESGFSEFEPGLQFAFDWKNNVHLLSKESYELFSEG